jgi:Polyketide cyclase / dehydrase and lipid transport
MSPDDEQMISHSVVVKASADVLYDMVAVINRMGEWSNTCTRATWDEGSGPVPSEGAWFTGHKVVADRKHDAHCEFVAAERPTTIAWMQGGRVDGVTEWRYRFTRVDGGTEVTESWTQVRPFPPDRVDDDMAMQMRRAFDEGIQETLRGVPSPPTRRTGATDYTSYKPKARCRAATGTTESRRTSCHIRPSSCHLSTSGRCSVSPRSCAHAGGH